MVEKSTNLVILDTKEKIIKTLEDAHIPVTVMQYILADVSGIINNATKRIIEQDKEKFYEETKKLEEEDKNELHKNSKIQQGNKDRK